MNMPSGGAPAIRHAMRVGALRVHAREGERAVQERVVRGDDDVVGGDAAAGRLDDAALVGVDLDGVRALVDLAAAGELASASASRYLRTWNSAWSSKRTAAATGYGSGVSLDERGGQPGLGGRLGLALDLGASEPRST